MKRDSHLPNFGWFLIETTLFPITNPPQAPTQLLLELEVVPAPKIPGAPRAQILKALKAPRALKLLQEVNRLLEVKREAIHQLIWELTPLQTMQ